MFFISSRRRSLLHLGTVLFVVLTLGLILGGCGGKKTPTPVPTIAPEQGRPLTPTQAPYVPKYLPTRVPTVVISEGTAGGTVVTVSVPPTRVQPKVEVVVNQAIGYNGPGETYTPIGMALAGEQLIVEERSPDGQWLHVCCFAGRPGWIALKQVRPLTDLGAIPVATVIPGQSPLPTPTP